MPEVSMQSIQEALKTYYLEGLRYQMNEKTTAFYSQILKTSKNINGVNIELPLRYGRQGGVGNRDDNTQNMPEPNPRKTKKAKWGTKNIFARIILTDKVIKATKNSKNAFASELELQLEDTMTDAKDSFNRQLFGDGVGIIGTVKTEAATTNTIALNSVRFLTEGQWIDILSSNGVTKKAEMREVLIVDDIANTVNFSGDAVSVVVGDILTINGNYNNELTGLDKIMENDTTIYGIDRSANKWFNAYKKDIQGAEISELAIQEIMDRAEIRTGSTPDFIMGSYGVKRACIYLLSQTRRIVNNLDLKGGYKALDYNGTPIVADKYQAEGTMDILCTENFTLNRLDDWDWLDKNGNILTRITNTAMYEAILALYGDLGCDKIRAQGRMINIKEH